MAAMFRSVVFVFLFVSSRGDDSILCTEQYCRDYSFDVGCGTAVQNCRINNSTHFGLELPSPTTCNCCEFCLAFILEGGSCSLGGAGDGINVPRCGPGLACVAEDVGNRCRRMQSSCHSSQDDYDARHALGVIGFLEERPRCDEKARYSPATCIPTQTCFCQSDEGERLLLGEVEYRDSNTLLRMQCGCSRRNHYIQKNIASFVRLPVIGPRCSQDGGYMPFQCDQNRCYCVDTITGNIVGSQTIDLDVQPLSDLTCYDASMDLFPFLNSHDATSGFNYTTPCQLEQEQRAELMQQSERDGYIVDYFSSILQCLPDGTYGRIREDIHGRKTCITENSVQIGEYSTMPGIAGYDEMDCKCALTSHLLRDRLERPVCCQNGNFRSIQCRRGQCYCVDSDGRQIGVESSDVTSLVCYTEHWRSC